MKHPRDKIYNKLRRKYKWEIYNSEGELMETFYYWINADAYLRKYALMEYTYKKIPLWEDES